MRPPGLPCALTFSEGKRSSKARAPHVARPRTYLPTMSSNTRITLRRAALLAATMNQ
jgi:hypothetical protein